MSVGATVILACLTMLGSLFIITGRYTRQAKWIIVTQRLRYGLVIGSAAVSVGCVLYLLRHVSIIDHGVSARNDVENLIVAMGIFSLACVWAATKDIRRHPAAMAHKHWRTGKFCPTAMRRKDNHCHPVNRRMASMHRHADEIKNALDEEERELATLRQHGRTDESTS